MVFEKILFAYATLIRDGQRPRELLPPDTILCGINKQENYSLSVTAGFVSKPNNNYWYTVDVLFSGKTVIDSSQDKNCSFIVWKTHKPSQEQSVSVCSFFLNKAVKFHSPGLYTAIVTIYETQEDSENDRYIDKKECFLIVPDEE